MVGEKFLDSLTYDSDGTPNGGDNNSYFQGYDWDVNRWVDLVRRSIWCTLVGQSGT